MSPGFGLGLLGMGTMPENLSSGGMAILVTPDGRVQPGYQKRPSSDVTVAKGRPGPQVQPPAP